MELRAAGNLLILLLPHLGKDGREPWDVPAKRSRSGVASSRRTVLMNGPDRRRIVNRSGSTGRKAGGLVYFAALYEAWRRQPGEWQRTFTIVTTDANELLAHYHDRMPVILSPDAAYEWIVALLYPATPSSQARCMIASTVSSAVCPEVSSQSPMRGVAARISSSIQPHCWWS